MRLLVLTQVVNEKDPILGFFVRWVREMTKYCERVDVVCLEKGEYNLPDNVRVFSCGKEEGVRSGLKLGWRVMKWCRKLVRENDRVFVHMCPEYALLCALFTKREGKRMVMWYAHGGVSWRLKLAEKVVDTIVTSTKEGCKLKSPKIEILQQGIDMELFKLDKGQEIKNVPSNFLYVGRVEPVKKIEVAIEALGLLSNEWVELGSQDWKEMIGFRDLLLKNPEIIDQYIAIKKESIKKAMGNGKKYREHKEKFIEEILRKAGIKF